MKKSIFIFIILYLALSSQITFSQNQKTQSKLEKKVQELEERIINLEAMNLKLLDKINEPNLNQNKQKGELVIIITKYIEAISSDDGIIPSYKQSIPEYYSNDKLLYETKSEYDPVLESIKNDLKLTYLRIQNYSSGSYKGIVYHGELGFFNTRQEAYEVIGKYLSKGFEDCNIIVKSVHDKE